MEYIEAEFIEYKLEYLSRTLGMLASGFSGAGGNENAEGAICVIETYVSSLIEEVKARKKPI